MTEKKTTTQRIYALTDANGEPRLVRAATKADAIVHVFRPHAEVASQDDLFTLASKGVQVETAGAPTTSTNGE